MKVTSKFPLKMCVDCGAEHLSPVPCGMTRGQRYRTVKVDSDWMPSRRAARSTPKVLDNGVTTTESEYYDDQALTEFFGDGLTGDERKELMMEETQGVGIATADDIEKYPELVSAHYLDGDDD